MSPARAFGAPLTGHRLSGVDLNLLVAFEALWAERHVTRAGKRLGLSQPAMSGALARLRELFSDPLFVRTPTGLSPTERCVELAGPVSSALAQVQRALSATSFEPMHSEREVTVGAVDAAIAAVMPAVVARVLREAPKLRLRVVAIDPAKATELVEAGALDLALTARLRPSASVKTRLLFPLELRRIVRRGHPLVSEREVEAALPRWPRVGVSFDGSPASGPPPAVTVSSFLAMAHFVGASDAWGLVPHRFAERLEREGLVRCVGAPVRVKDLALRLVWPQTQDAAPLSRWLREQVLLAAKST
ncbi:MAG: LysR family transcriptional regulator [Myxococcaceae bacterium]|nr:LysR family transcriptional regulator [Myxococcaceae bacterium]